MNRAIAPIGLYIWHQWNQKQAITLPMPMWLMPTGLLRSAHDS